MSRSPIAKIGGLKVIVPVLGLIWLGIFIFGLWPALKENRARAERIGEIETRIETLGGWQEARVALTGDVGQWDRDLSDRFDRLFPKERQLKELFYQIAEAADASGINPITVRSLSETHKAMTAQQAQQQNDDMSMDMTMDMAMGDTGMDGMGSNPDALFSGLGLTPDEFPDNSLNSHFLIVDFDASFNDLTRFLERLDRLERSITVNSVELSPGDKGTAARIDLEYYVQASK